MVVADQDRKDLSLSVDVASAFSEMIDYVQNSYPTSNEPNFKLSNLEEDHLNPYQKQQMEYQQKHREVQKKKEIEHKIRSRELKQLLSSSKKEHSLTSNNRDRVSKSVNIRSKNNQSLPQIFLKPETVEINEKWMRRNRVRNKTIVQERLSREQEDKQNRAQMVAKRTRERTRTFQQYQRKRLKQLTKSFEQIKEQREEEQERQVRKEQIRNRIDKQGLELAIKSRNHEKEVHDKFLEIADNQLNQSKKSKIGLIFEDLYLKRTVRLENFREDVQTISAKQVKNFLTKETRVSPLCIPLIDMVTEYKAARKVNSEYEHFQKMEFVSLVKNIAKRSAIIEYSKLSKQDQEEGEDQKGMEDLVNKRMKKILSAISYNRPKKQRKSTNSKVRSSSKKGTKLKPIQIDQNEKVFQKEDDQEIKENVEEKAYDSLDEEF